MQTLKTAVTRYQETGITKTDINSANEFLEAFDVPFRIEASFYQIDEAPVVHRSAAAKFDAVWLDEAIHRPRLSEYHLSVFTVSRDVAYELSPGNTRLRGYQSFPNMPIGEAVVYNREGDYIDKRLGTDDDKHLLTQGAYTLLHEIMHWFYDRKGLPDQLHDVLDAAKQRGGSDLYENGYAALADLLATYTGEFKTLKYVPTFEPSIRHLDHYWEGNSPESLVFHTLLGSVEGSYSWLEQIKLSYNYIISADGKVYEQVHWSDSAWHAGRVSKMIARARAFFGLDNPNRRSVGIAFERNGEDRLTPETVAAGVALSKWLGQQTGIMYDWDNSFSHVDITADKPVEVRGYRNQIMSELLGDRGPDTGAVKAIIQQVLRLPVSKMVKLTLLKKVANYLQSFVR